MFPFRKTNVRFETTSQRQKEGASSTVLETILSGYSSQEDKAISNPVKVAALSPEVVPFCLHLVLEVEEPTMDRILSELSIYFLFSLSIFWNFHVLSVLLLCFGDRKSRKSSSYAKVEKIQQPHNVAPTDACPQSRLW